ncbi:MAG: hypothetical protein NTU45_01670, partial [Planctomycetota bacterium]|nr:hypothetical protein [Planctomycetota bacterium]
RSEVVLWFDTKLARDSSLDFSLDSSLDSSLDDWIGLADFQIGIHPSELIHSSRSSQQRQLNLPTPRWVVV